MSDPFDRPQPAPRRPAGPRGLVVARDRWRGARPARAALDRGPVPQPPSRRATCASRTAPTAPWSITEADGDLVDVVAPGTNGFLRGVDARPGARTLRRGVGAETPSS